MYLYSYTVVMNNHLVDCSLLRHLSMCFLGWFVCFLLYLNFPPSASNGMGKKN